MKHLKEITCGLDLFYIHRLLDQLDEHPELWSTENNWTHGKSFLQGRVTIELRYNKTPPGMFPGTGWNAPAFMVLPAAEELIFDVMRKIPGEHLGKVMISRMPPGDKIDWHTDKWPLSCAPYWQRYQIPLQVEPGVRFCVADEDVYMEPGSAWWFDNQQSHAVFNESPVDRISMFADIRPFSLER